MMKLKNVRRVFEQDRVNKWFEEAYHDPTISRFLSMADRRVAETAGYDDWDGILLMDETGRGLLKASFDRIHLEVTTSVYVITRDGDTKATRGIIVYSLFAKFHELMCNLYPSFMHVRSVVDVRNDASMKLCRSIFGEPWGIEPSVIYDANTQTRVGSAHFKCSVDQLKLRFNNT